jgi:hypothetical protein
VEILQLLQKDIRGKALSYELVVELELLQRRLTSSSSLDYHRTKVGFHENSCNKAVVASMV